MATLDFHRKNQHFLGSWWRTVDRLTLLTLIIIIAFSAIMVATASPAVAERIGVEAFYFIRRQLFFLCISLVIMVGSSFLSPAAIRRLAVIGFLIGLVLLVIVLFKGTAIKGARRWVSLLGFSLQPSEFIKPLFAVTTGWLLSLGSSKSKFPAMRVCMTLYTFLVCLLILQPDFGMTVTVSLVWGGQLFVAGLSLLWALVAVLLGLVGVVGAYLFLPHVTQRINSFLEPGGSENYQVKRSLEAFINGGFYGRGPGEGTVKQVLPDSHTDFIFAVVGEELGMVTCLVVIALFAFIVVRGFIRITHETDLFAVYAASGLLMQFGMQAVINMGVTLHLFPTKGMTLPFISYGGSSMLAIAVAMGMMLALTRRRYGVVKSRI